MYIVIYMVVMFRTSLRRTIRRAILRAIRRETFAESRSMDRFFAGGCLRSLERQGFCEWLCEWLCKWLCEWHANGSAIDFANGSQHEAVLYLSACIYIYIYPFIIF